MVFRACISPANARPWYMPRTGGTLNRLATSLVIFSIVFHFLVFLVEALLWMQPAIHEPVLTRLLHSELGSLHDQAQLLSAVLVNQGFYNLFLALAGTVGLVLQRRGHAAAGHALVVYMCLSAAAAGLVLACSTPAYLGAFFQGVPPALALLASKRRALIPSPA